MRIGNLSIMKKTSLVLATYNGIKYIGDLLDSIRNQTRRLDEVIVADDVSTDGTFEYVLKYAREYSLDHWIIYQNSHNLGWMNNFRHAFQKVSGDLIFLCDQDDIWMEEKVDDLSEIMETHENIQVIASNYEPFYTNTDVHIRTRGVAANSRKIKQVKLEKAHLNVIRPGCTFCVRKKLINQIMNNDMENSAHDAMIWRAAIVQDALYLYEKPLIKYRRHSDNATDMTRKHTLQEQLDHLDWLIACSQFFLDDCVTWNISTANQELLKRDICDMKKRKEVMAQGSLLKLIQFQVKNIHHYTTFRNLLADIKMMMDYKKELDEK